MALEYYSSMGIKDNVDIYHEWGDQHTCYQYHRTVLCQAEPCYNAAKYHTNNNVDCALLKISQYNYIMPPPPVDRSELKLGLSHQYDVMVHSSFLIFLSVTFLSVTCKLKVYTFCILKLNKLPGMMMSLMWALTELKGVIKHKLRQTSSDGMQISCSIACEMSVLCQKSVAGRNLNV